MGKMMMLVAAKWREFMNQNSSTQQQEEEELSEEQEYAPKPSRTRAAKVCEFVLLLSFRKVLRSVGFPSSFINYTTK